MRSAVIPPNPVVVWLFSAFRPREEIFFGAVMKSISNCFLFGVAGGGATLR